MAPGDLEYNRRGLLGPGQRAQLEALIASYGKLRFGLGPAADTGREFVAQMRQALQDGRVMASTGAVKMDHPAFRVGLGAQRHDNDPGKYGPAYVATIDGGGTFQLAHWVNLLPGRYEFYVAAWAGFVVGASPLPPFEHAQTFFVALCDAQNITAETLAENRRGWMTEAQKRALKPGKGTSWKDIFTPYAVMALFASLPVAQLLGFIRMRKEGAHVAWLLCGSIFLIFVAWTYALVTEPGRDKAKLLDTEEGRVATIEGLLCKNFSPLRQLMYRDIEIGSRTFHLADRLRLYITLLHGFNYRAYFAPRSGQLLAIELLPQEERS
ncbi:MAG: hypothetical protein ACMG6S_01395 [Byssovorax sp.]